jgi:hypothetical protein
MQPVAGCPAARHGLPQSATTLLSSRKKAPDNKCGAKQRASVGRGQLASLPASPGQAAQNQGVNSLQENTAIALRWAHALRPAQQAMQSGRSSAARRARTATRGTHFVVASALSSRGLGSTAPSSPKCNARNEQELARPTIRVETAVETSLNSIAYSNNKNVQTNFRHLV